MIQTLTRRHLPTFADILVLTGAALQIYAFSHGIILHICTDQYDATLS